ncbi:MAG: hypothetical protein CMJ49_11315 [Planctomycetaceae bacterium]|nr:hypothetical protein [Planctomycetaceae bacterium]
MTAGSPAHSDTSSMPNDPVISATHRSIRWRIAIAAALALATAAVYAQVATFDFVSWDDPIYVFENEQVVKGLTFQGIAWAFISEHGANWHPLTGVSHMIDCTLFGVDRPGAHHLVNVAWHIVCVVLLFLVLEAMTAAPIRSAVVAALFALHPQHVESVAWISQRKDVLSTALMLLALWTYTRHVQRGGRKKYIAALILFAGALMAKPMVVMFPVLLVLLDVWPFNRWIGFAASPTNPQRPAPPRHTLKHLALEKIPFFALSLATGIGTILVQSDKEASVAFKVLSLGDRLAHAVVAYVQYIGKMFWPVDLTFLYPHPYMPYMTGSPRFSTLQIVGAAALLIAITVGFLFVARRYRYGIVGWLWFLVSVLPVIGFLQVGGQGIADRYTYVSFVGLFIILTWAAVDLLIRLKSLGPAPRVIAAILVAALLTAAATLTYQQVGTWRDSKTLYRHAIAVDHRVPVVHNNLANVLMEEGDYETAADVFREALALMPGFSKFHENLGRTLRELGRYDQVVYHFQRAAQLDSKSVEIQNDLAWILATHPDANIRNVPQAIQYAQHATRLTNFNDPGILDTLAAAYASGGRFDRAIEVSQHALQLLAQNPDPTMEQEIQQHMKLFRAAQPVIDHTLGNQSPEQ